MANCIDSYELDDALAPLWRAVLHLAEMQCQQAKIPHLRGDGELYALLDPGEVHAFKENATFRIVKGEMHVEYSGGSAFPLKPGYFRGESAIRALLETECKST